MTSGVINTTLMALYVDVASTNTKIGLSTDASISISHSARDISSKDSDGWMENAEGQLSWSATVSGHFAFDAAYSAVDIETAVLNRTPLDIVFSTEVSGDTFYTGNAYVDSFDIDSSGVEDNVSYTISFTGNGHLTTGAVA
ncbi:MAG: phage tail protein [Flavobacteriales bacterium]|nr:phage tail protein [Flavobacteriales bacterium]